MANIKRGIINYILSFKTKGQGLLAALLYAIFALCGVIIYLYFDNIHLRTTIDDVKMQTQQQLKQNSQDYNDKLINFYKSQNADMLRIQYKLDSAKAELEIFKIKKQMK